MRRRLIEVAWVLLLAGMGGAGFVPWKVTAPAQRLCRFLSSRNAGWQITLQQARWIPWQSLELADLQVQTPRGGRLHLVRVRLHPQIWTLVRGNWETRWEFGEIRMDPRSWNIRRPLAQEILSTGPVTTGGFAILRVDRNQWTLLELVLHGPLLRLQAKGWCAERTRQAELLLNGELPRTLLEAMNLLRPDQALPEPWEPFELRVAGSMAAPEVRFSSNFFTCAMTPQLERGS